MSYNWIGRTCLLFEHLGGSQEDLSEYEASSVLQNEILFKKKQW